MKLTSIDTLQDVKSFVHILMEDEKLNFHPDTPFEDYVLIGKGLPFYSSKEAEVRNGLLDQAFELGDRLEVDTNELMCDVGFSIIRSSFRKTELED